MAEIDQALRDLRSIRSQVARSAEFRGYGPLTLGVTAVVALAAGGMQAAWVPAPAAAVWPYACLWLGTGVLCAALVGTQMWWRSQRVHAGMGEAMLWAAVREFAPAACAGVAAPVVVLHASPESCWLLPGLWQVIFSLGVFACCRALPRALLLVAGWFLLSGLGCMAAGPRYALRPWWMAGAFAVGMGMAAALHARAARDAGDGEEE